MDIEINTEKTKKRKSSSKSTHKADENLKIYINQVLEDTKALDIAIIDLAGKSSIADYMIIASGTSTRHVSHIAEELDIKLKQKFGINCKIEGANAGDWVVLDAIDAIIHIFRPEIREFYNLEKLWGSDFSDTSFTLYTK